MRENIKLVLCGGNDDTLVRSDLMPGPRVIVFCVTYYLMARSCDSCCVTYPLMVGHEMAFPITDHIVTSHCWKCCFTSGWARRYMSIRKTKEMEVFATSGFRKRLIYQIGTHIRKSIDYVCEDHGEAVV